MRNATKRWIAGSFVLGSIFLFATPQLVLADTLDTAFDGQASSTSADSPGFYTVGEDYTMYLELSAIPFQNAPWYPWDITREYTAVVTVPVSSFRPPFGVNGFRAVGFGTGSVQIYEDETPNADPTDTSTYSDGLLLLWGTVTGMNGSGSGSPSELVMSFNTAAGDPSDGIEFMGGAGIGNVACDTGVKIEMNDAASFDPAPPSGYDENYVASWSCSATTITVEEDTWGRVKALYR